MASKTTLVDDLDESVDTDVRTVTFGHEGATFEIDLGAKHREELESALNKFLDKARAVNRKGGPARPARPASPARTTSAGVVDTDAVRAWARENGHEVSDKGRIANKVLDAYHAANPAK
jgi:hypothetical protein